VLYERDLVNRFSQDFLSQPGFKFRQQIEDDFFKLTDHVLEVLKWRFQGLKLYSNLPLITEFQIHILLQSMILYHCFLIWDPQQI